MVGELDVRLEKIQNGVQVFGGDQIKIQKYGIREGDAKAGFAEAGRGDDLNRLTTIQVFLDFSPKICEHG